VIFVRHGCAMVANVFRVMHAAAHYRMQSALNANAASGITAGGCSNVHFVIPSCVRMINLSIKQVVKFWSLKITNVKVVIKWANTLVFAARHVTARTT